MFLLVLSKFMRSKCFANALARNPDVVLFLGFLLRAKDDLLKDVDPDHAGKLLEEAKTWASLSAEQIKQLITKDVNFCALIKAAPQGKSLVISSPFP